MTTYGKIENNTYIPAPNLTPENLKERGFIPFDEDLVSLYFAGLITLDELINRQANIDKKKELQLKIDELDNKRIRALAEGGNYSETQTYLDYYTEQIKVLREQIKSMG